LDLSPQKSISPGSLYRDWDGMRRKRLLLGLMLAIFICGVLALVSATCKAETTDGRILYVGGDGPGNYTKIQDAIDNASDGDIIFVKSGVYKENVVLNKNVSIEGENRETTILEAASTERRTLELYKVSNCKISNITIRGAKGDKSNLYLSECRNVTIQYCSIEESEEGDGIFLYRCSLISIRNNSILNNKQGNGILLAYSSYCIITNNKISGNQIGIFLQYQSCNNTIARNYIEDNLLVGVRIPKSGNFLINPRNNTIFENVFKSNGQNAEDCVNVTEERNLWYNPETKRGNYWDDYQGKDANHDGIGDTPYCIPGNAGSKDEYVLGFFAGDEDSHQPTNQKPVADAGGDYYGTVNESIRFDASQSRDPDGEIVEYIWDFGDGSTGKGKVVTHSYSTPGNYTVTLTVVDDDGAEDSDTTLAHISEYTQNKKPVPVIESKDIAVIGEIIEFNASKSYDPDGEIVTYIWKFGDGKVDYGKVVEHSYSEPGTYEVTLEVVDNLGYKNSTKKSIVILAEGEKVNADFHVETDLLFVGAEIVFNASESSGAIVSYIWEFGDGENITTSSPVCNHTYTKPGIYVVNLTVVGIDGEKDTKSLTIVIEGAWKKETPGFGLAALVVSILLIYVVRRRWISME